jgi:hypothetical protein
MKWPNTVAIVVAVGQFGEVGAAITPPYHSGTPHPVEMYGNNALNPPNEQILRNGVQFTTASSSSSASPTIFSGQKP